MAEDLEDTKEDLAADQKFLAELEKGCATKEAEWATRCKIRSEELLAIADTIKILNDDDALDLFKKTLPAPSLMQLKTNSRATKLQALTALQEAGGINGDYRLNLISL